MSIDTTIKPLTTSVKNWGRDMRISSFGKVTIALFALCASALAWGQTQVTGADYEIGQDGVVTITLSTSGAEPVVSIFATDSPARIVLITGADIDAEANPVYRIAVESRGGFSLARSLRGIDLLLQELGLSLKIN